MALFGFNKQKVLANAEKYVQQGKLQNAISEYEKVLKNDPKDLTVNNTIGDLYSRIGESDRATDCFKTVGDAYASQGFTVKAIAMYKKISKLKPSLESLLKLAELYTQQGLFNDARAQYLQVAEEFLKSGELENAVRIFQKILEMDPEATCGSGWLKSTSAWARKPKPGRFSPPRRRPCAPKERWLMRKKFCSACCSLIPATTTLC
jgi:tetratricopeptide (TPR) repeat protein